MPTSTKPSTARGRLYARRPAELAAGFAIAALSACAPAVTTAPVTDGLPNREPPVRVGLAVDTARIEVSSAAGVEIVDAGAGRALGDAGAGERVVLTSGSDGALRYTVGGGAARSTGTTTVLVRPRRGGTLEIAGKPYRGSALIRASAPGSLTAINQVEMEEYLLGVVPREIGKVGEELLEAAKAQAVAARTYAVRYLGRRAELGFDVFATVQDQVYGGMEAEHEPVSRAVRETAGEILVYNGDPIEAFYHSTCAGQTAAIEEVWPTERPRPYLVSVVDRDPRTGEAFDRTSNRFQWTQRWTAEELTEILDRTLADSLPAGRSSIGELRDIEVLERTPSERIRRMRISTTAGDFFVGGDRIRWILRTPEGPILNSSRFDVRVERGADGRVREVIAEGGGWGHGIGMCQVGAMGRARAGQDYRTILRTYYSGAEIRDLY